MHVNATDELNAPYRRNDINTTHAVMSHIDSRYPGEFGELHYRCCVQKALSENEAAEGCRLADEIAAKLRNVRSVRERFQSEINLRGSL